MSYCAFEDIVRRIDLLTSPALIAIDGLPCSGKSTLAERLERHFGIESVYLEDFVLPASAWPRPLKPAFPFEYMRYAEFVGTVKALACSGVGSYAPFDWSKLDIAETTRTVRLDKPVIIEGVSALNPVLAPLYGLCLFVESDRSTTFQAALDRGVGDWVDEWQTLFLPSADLYMRTDPKSRADMIFAGRGAENMAA